MTNEYRCLHQEPLPEIEGAMTNFDYSIDREMEGLDAEHMADYAGWEFHALVYRPGPFVADVHRYHQHVDFIEAETPRELMEAVCDVWGVT